MSNPRYLEYTSAAVPIIEHIKPQTISSTDEHFICSPNLQAGYIKLIKGVPLQDNFLEASSHIFYVLNGRGKTEIGTIRNTQKCPGKVILWNKGDVFTIPYYEGKSQHLAFEEDTILFTSDDSPLLNFLNCFPKSPRFEPTIYKHNDMMNEIKKFNSEEGSEKRNRNGILLSNDQMIKEKLNTVTHTMWSLLNFIGPHSVQKPHRHNSIAIDLCIDACEDSKSQGKVYTLMGKELHEDGTIKNPVKMVWKKGCTFTTPPGWWHSHHNESNKEAWVFPVQDAGLHTFMRTLDINFFENKLQTEDNYINIMYNKKILDLEASINEIKDKLSQN